MAGDIKHRGRRNLPGIVGIGAQKAGTSWLFENLAQHPKIWPTPFKELHFFDFKFKGDARRWGKWHVRSNVRRLLAQTRPGSQQAAYLKGLIEGPVLNGTWYKAVFAPMTAGQIGLDVTPEYSSLPPEGIEFFKKFLGRPKVIYIIRDPLERAVSQIKMNMVRHSGRFEDTAAWEQAVEAPEIVARGNYSTYVPRWDTLFPSEDLLYLPYGDIERDPIGLLRRVEAFVGLDPAQYRRPHVPVHIGEKINVPQFVVERLAEKTAPQKAFLYERFGADFLEMTARKKKAA